MTDVFVLQKFLLLCLLKRVQKMRHRIMNNGSRIYDCGNADADHFYSHTLFCQAVPVISHTGTGIDSRICDLNSSAQSFCASGCKGVYGNDHVRLCLLHDPAYNLRRFHARLRHHSRGNSADTVDLLSFDAHSSVFPEHMAGHTHIFHNKRTQGICRNPLISKSYHKHGLLFFQIDQLSEVTGKLLGYFSVIILVRNRKIRRFDRDIISLWTPHCLCPVFCSNLHNCSSNILFPVIVFLNLHTSNFHIFLLKAFLRLQCKVCSDPVSCLHGLSLSFPAINMPDIIF